jgi:hypothetical protein
MMLHTENGPYQQYRYWVFHLKGASAMDGPIYKFFRVRFIEAWYQLSQAEKDKLFAQNTALQKQFGIKSLALCNSSWSNERWTAFGIEEYPDMTTVEQFNAALVKEDWFRYIETETMLGTVWT